MMPGLTNDIRSNRHIMKDLKNVTKMSPDHRRDMIRRFVEEIRNNKVTQELLSEWGLLLNNNLIRFIARQLNPEAGIFQT